MTIGGKGWSARALKGIQFIHSFISLCSNDNDDDNYDDDNDCDYDIDFMYLVSWQVGAAGFH